MCMRYMGHNSWFDLIDGIHSMGNILFNGMRNIHPIINLVCIRLFIFDAIMYLPIGILI